MGFGIRRRCQFQVLIGDDSFGISVGKKYVPNLNLWVVNNLNPSRLKFIKIDVSIGIVGVRLLLSSPIIKLERVYLSKWLVLIHWPLSLDNLHKLI